MTFTTSARPPLGYTVEYGVRLRRVVLRSTLGVLVALSVACSAPDSRADVAQESPVDARASSPDAEPQPATPVDGVWVDPAFAASSGSVGRSVIAVVWFDRQLIEGQDSYLERTEDYRDLGRSALRERVIDTLKTLSESSYQAAEATLRELETDGTVRDCRRHWIVNAISCRIASDEAAQLANLPGAWKVFLGTRRFRPATISQPVVGPEFAPDTGELAPFDPADRPVAWSVEAIGAPRVWRELGITGDGVLTVFSDFGFKFDIPSTVGSLYRNPGEIAANGLDDDGNGYIDDVHGFNFDAGSSALNRARLSSGDRIHGNATATLVAGRAAEDTGRLLGIAPDSRWAAMISTNELEAGIEWALEQDADLINMSFSLPTLGEYRSHWRRVMEHAALAGLYLVSGAGNFASPDYPAYREIPHQMGIPEGIPEAVFGVAGLDANRERPDFSSQGPVLWDTEHYGEGEVRKPDLATFNFDIPVTDLDGNETVPGVSGNSFAAPHLVGVLALMLEADPELTPRESMEILRATASDVGDTGFDHQTGWGLVDAFEAVSEVMRRRDAR